MELVYLLCQLAAADVCEQHRLRSTRRARSPAAWAPRPSSPASRGPAGGSPAGRCAAPRRAADRGVRPTGAASGSEPFGLGQPVDAAAGGQRVGEQAGDGHRPDAARHRRDRAGDLRRRRRSRRRRPAPALPSGPSMRLMPTSITVAPGLIQSPPTIRGRPTAATRMSARRQTAARSRVRECATVTVQLSRSSSCAIGLPTMFERPTTTASRPARLAEPVAQQHQAAERRAGHHRLAARWRAAPTFETWKPSTSFSGATASSTRAASMCAGSGSCTRMPCTSGSRFSRSIEREDRRLGRRGGQPVLLGVHAGLDGSAGPCCGRRPGSPGRRRRAPPRAPG